MKLYSVGVRLAWQVAAFEAANKKTAQIEIDHIMLGILSMEKIQERIRVRSAQDYEELLVEKEKLYKILYYNKLNPTTLRRSLRHMLPDGNGLPANGVYHRSKECKQLFVELSDYPNHYVTLKRLFLAIVNLKKASYFYQLLIRLNVNIEDIKLKIMFSVYNQN
ncbi:hypothetical protein SAMN06265379_10564 [Saccharicrinis carchari]|uniref:Clp amino terminal domain-containing protein, pathogenicity island component n=1 Tax=Saccharicrinis carchari TaxID=1168039 RepID=A0A521DCX2_SACCC|nr:hypothetical protein [Saccharicrinis carchari]SMO69438.1 hypothetical protein SAMN06265379_10564 [Saccharicrinis carchari]